MCVPFIFSLDCWIIAGSLHQAGLGGKDPANSLSFVVSPVVPLPAQYLKAGV